MLLSLLSVLKVMLIFFIVFVSASSLDSCPVYVNVLHALLKIYLLFIGFSIILVLYSHLIFNHTHGHTRARAHAHTSIYLHTVYYTCKYVVFCSDIVYSWKHYFQKTLGLYFPNGRFKALCFELLY